MEELNSYATTPDTARSTVNKCITPDQTGFAQQSQPCSLHDVKSGTSPSENIMSIQQGSTQNQKEPFDNQKTEVAKTEPEASGEEAIENVTPADDKELQETNGAAPQDFLDEALRKREMKKTGLDETPQLKKPRLLDADETESFSPHHDALESQAPRRSNRERKAVQRDEFVSAPEDAVAGDDGVQAEEDVPMDEPKIQEGRGTALGSIPVFIDNYKSLKGGATALRKLFKALYGVPGRPQARKDHLLAWSGLMENIEETKLATDISRVCTVADLRDIGKKLLGLSSGIGGKDTKQAWIDAITPILANPSSSVILHATASDTKGARPSMTGYQIFCAEVRGHVAAENPTANNKEVMRLLGAKWRSLSDEEKQKYQLLSREGRLIGSPDRKRSGSIKSNRKSNRRRKQDSTDEEVEQEHYEEEDDEEEEKDATDDGVQYSSTTKEEDSALPQANLTAEEVAE